MCVLLPISADLTLPLLTHATAAAQGEIVVLPAGCKAPDPSYLGLDQSRLLINLNIAGSGQTVYVQPGEAVSGSCTYQIYSGVGNPSEINQGFFIMSWTPTWPAPSGYYIPIWNGISGAYPGVTNTADFSFTVPTTPGTYYLYWCGWAEYTMEGAVGAYNQQLTLPAHAKIVVTGLPNQPPDQPSNVSPSNGATGVSLTPTLQSSAFSDPDAGDTHAASQWQITTTPGDYNSPLFDSGTDSSNLTSIAVPSGRLNPNTTYYWHVRHQDNHGAWSSYSDETCFTTLTTIGPPLADTPWPMFHHDLQHTGLSPYVGPEAPLFKWSYATGSHVISSPAIGADGTVYVGSYFDNTLYALNPDGTLKWSCYIGSHVASSPAIGADATIYVGGDGMFLALNPDGTVKWSHAANIRGSSPAIGADGTIYVGSPDGLHAFNPDGTVKWNCAVGFISYSSPAIGPDGTIYVESYDGDVCAISPIGALKWRCAADTTLRWLNDSSPAIGPDGTIYVGSDDGNLCAINPDGTLKWSYTTGGRVYSSPAIGADGTIYVGSQDTNLYAINPDGSLKWSYATRGWVDYTSPAIDAAGTIYIGSDDGNLYAVNSDGTLKWSYLTGGAVRSSPAIGADGTIYVGSDDGKLYAIGIGGCLPPSITAVSPSEGLPGQSLTVTITGDRFTGATAVSFGVYTITVNSFTVDSSTQITASISISDSAYVPGGADVSVTTPCGIGTKTGSFFVFAPPPPTIVSVSPSQGVQGQSLDATISGTYFTQTVSVDFGSGIVVFDFWVNSDIQITAHIAIMSSATPGARDISVTTTGGTGTLTNGFTVNEAVPTNQPPNQPSNVSPANGATGVSLTPTLQSSAFSDPDTGDTHAASQWQITTTPGDYSSPIFDSGTDAADLESITIPSGTLSESTTYYWHVRHQDNRGDWSNWSTETSFTTIGVAQYTLTVNVGGSGSVSKNPDQATYTYGTPVQLTATAEPGWTFSGWSGDLTGSTNPDTITMDSDKTVTATFIGVETLNLDFSFTYGPLDLNMRSFSLLPGDEVIQFTRDNLIVGTNANGFLTTVERLTHPVSGDLSGTLSVEINEVHVWWDELPPGTEKGFAVGKFTFDDGSGNTFGGVLAQDEDVDSSMPGTVYSNFGGYGVSTWGTGEFSGQVLIGTVSSSAAFDTDTGVGNCVGSITLRRYSSSEVSGPGAFTYTGTLAGVPELRNLGDSSGPLANDEFVQFTRANISIPSSSSGLFYVEGVSATASATGALTGSITASTNGFNIPGTSPADQGWGVGKFAYSDGAGSISGISLVDNLGGYPQIQETGYMFALYDSGTTTGAYAGKDYYATLSIQEDHTVSPPAFSGEGNLYEMSPSPNQAPAQPSNISPANGATDVSLTPTLESSEFSDPDAGDTHAASEWQVTATSGDYSSPVFDSGTDADNLESIAIPSGTLSESTTYYWHVRHQDNHGAWSAWSTETSFSTYSSSQPNVLTVVSLVGDQVSTSPTGPFVAATTAYLGSEVGRIQPDGGLPEYAHIQGAYWIWMDDFIGDLDHPLYFLKTFSIPDGAVGITGTIQITADNFFNLSINGMDYGGTTPPDTYQFENIYTFPVTNLSPGENHLLITVWEDDPGGTPSGLVYKLTVETGEAPPTNHAPNQPTNALPANGADGIGLTPTLQSSAFSDPDAGDTHAASQWQITTTPGDYFSPVFDSGTDAANLESIAIPSGTLSESTTYYWHVRHQDNHGDWSSWSAETSFTTGVETLNLNFSFSYGPSDSNRRSFSLLPGDEVIQFTRENLIVGTNANGSIWTVNRITYSVSGDLSGTMSVEVNEVQVGWDELPPGAQKGFLIGKVTFDDGSGNAFGGVLAEDEDLDFSTPGIVYSNQRGYAVSTWGTGEFSGQILIGTGSSTVAFNTDTGVGNCIGSMVIRRYSSSEVSGPKAFSFAGTLTSVPELRNLGASSGPLPNDEFVQFTRANISIPSSSSGLGYLEGASSTLSTTGALTGTMIVSNNNLLIPGTSPADQGYTFAKFSYSDGTGTIKGVALVDNLGGNPQPQETGYMFALYDSGTTTGAYAGKDYYATLYVQEDNTVFPPVFSGNGNLYEMSPLPSVPTAHTLTMNVIGSGSVSKNPDQATYTYGTPVQLTATAEPGWTFSGWSGDLTGSTNPDTITMDGDKTVTATFTEDQYTLTVNVIGSGSVSKNPDQATYTYGTPVHLTAVPDLGCAFSGWSGNLTGSTNPNTIIMDGDKTVTATFTTPDLVLPPVADSKVAAQSPKNNYGSSTSVDVQAYNAGNRQRGLFQFDLSGIPVGSTIESATFAAYYYSSYLASLNPAGRTYNLYPNTNPWTENAVTWNTRPGYDTSQVASAIMPDSFGWVTWDVTTMVQGWVDGTPNYGFVMMDSNETGGVNRLGMFHSREYADSGYTPWLVIDYVAPEPGTMHTLTVTVIGNGTVAKDPDLPLYTDGRVVQLTAVPDLGCAFSGWSGNLTGSTNPNTIIMDGDKTVTATFTTPDLVLPPVADSKVAAQSPKNNYGSSTSVDVQAYNAGNRQRGLFQFDLSGIPVGSTIESATFAAYYYSSYLASLNPAGRTYNLYPNTNPWTENAVTWNTRPGYDTSQVASAIMPDSFGWVTWDVTTMVQGWVDGTPNYGFVMMDSNETGGVNRVGMFRSREYADSGYTPWLVVHYTP
jgi:uncharacterized repeat protein (TIGR02543 family)